MIRTELIDGVLVLWLARGERRNAMVPEMMGRMVEVFEGAAEAGAFGVVLAAEGPAFCVGADLKWLGMLDAPGEGVGELVAVHHQVVRAMRRVPLPVVAAVQGAAAGGGMSLALACDYRVAAPAAVLTPAYFRIGLVPDGGNSLFLSRALGPVAAMGHLVANRSLAADEAVRLGLLDELVPAEQLVARACTVARETAETVPPESLLATRRLLDEAGGTPLERVLDLEQEAMAAAARHPRFAEAVQRFASSRAGAKAS